MYTCKHVYTNWHVHLQILLHKLACTPASIYTQIGMYIVHFTPETTSRHTGMCTALAGTPIQTCMSYTYKHTKYRNTTVHNCECIQGHKLWWHRSHTRCTNNVMRKIKQKQPYHTRGSWKTQSSLNWGTVSLSPKQYSKLCCPMNIPSVVPSALSLSLSFCVSPACHDIRAKMGEGENLRWINY